MSVPSNRKWDIRPGRMRPFPKRFKTGQAEFPINISSSSSSSSDSEVDNETPRRSTSVRSRQISPVVYGSRRATGPRPRIPESASEPEEEESDRERGSSYDPLEELNNG